MGKIFIPFARFAIFIIYFWFGILKIIDASPASPLILSLLEKTISFVSLETFLLYFGIFEIIVGVSFLIPRLERISITLLIIHMVIVAMPLFMLKSLTWQDSFIPTMEGQYIIKNILFIALAIGIATRINPKYH